MYTKFINHIYFKMCVCLAPFQYITGGECCVINSESVWYTTAPHSLDLLINDIFTQRNVSTEHRKVGKEINNTTFCNV